MSGSSTQLLRIGWFLPGSFHLYGERGNILALVHESQRLGWTPEVTRIELPDLSSFDPGAYDILVSPPGELDALEAAVPLLAPQLPALQQWIAAGGNLQSTGSNVALWGQGITRLDGRQQAGLGLIDVTAEERAFVTGDDLWVHYTAPDGSQHEAIGHQIQQLRLFPGPSTELWGTDIVYGYGMNGQGYTGPRIGPATATGNTPLDAEIANAAGLRLGNSLFTVMLGPALFVNKQLLVDLLTPLADAKGWPLDLSRLDLAESQSSLQDKSAYIQRKMAD